MYFRVKIILKSNCNYIPKQLLGEYLRNSVKKNVKIGYVTVF
jgi:hypothetical protein